MKEDYFSITFKLFVLGVAIIALAIAVKYCIGEPLPPAPHISPAWSKPDSFTYSKKIDEQGNESIAHGIIVCQNDTSVYLESLRGTLRGYFIAKNVFVAKDWTVHFYQDSVVVCWFGPHHEPWKDIFIP